MDRGQANRTMPDVVMDTAGGVSAPPRRSTRSPTIDIVNAADLMQEAALVLEWDPDPSGPAIGDCRIRHVNKLGRQALPPTGADPVNRRLSDILAADTAADLHRVCVAALDAEGPVEHFAVAPDPITDLGGTSCVAVRAIRVGDAVLCVWLPGELDVADEADAGVPLDLPAHPHLARPSCGCGLSRRPLHH